MSPAPPRPIAASHNTYFGGPTMPWCPTISRLPPGGRLSAISALLPAFESYVALPGFSVPNELLLHSGTCINSKRPWNLYNSIDASYYDGESTLFAGNLLEEMSGGVIGPLLPVLPFGTDAMCQGIFLKFSAADEEQPSIMRHNTVIEDFYKATKETEFPMWSSQISLKNRIHIPLAYSGIGHALHRTTKNRAPFHLGWNTSYTHKATTPLTLNLRDTPAMKYLTNYTANNFAKRPSSTNLFHQDIYGTSSSTSGELSYPSHVIKCS